jgi:hypothetical protein
MFAWAPAPPRFAGMGSEGLSKLLLARAKLAVSPQLGFGEHGEGYVRIALVENTPRLHQAVRSIRAFMQSGTNQTEPAAAGAAAGTRQRRQSGPSSGGRGTGRSVESRLQRRPMLGQELIQGERARLR